MIEWLILTLKISRKCWRSIVMILAPIILSPFLIYNTKESLCAYVIILMVIYWTTEPIPIPVTALIPVVLFPLLGVLTTEQASAPYLQSTNMLFMASLIIAIAVESSNLHKRIAFKILTIIGTDIRWLIAGFMLTAMFLGIWIINTAATAMLLPIADVIVQELFILNNSCENNINELDVSTSNDLILSDNHEESKMSNTKGQYQVGDKLESEKNDKLRRIMYLSIAYSATIGGTTTLTSNGPNLVLRWVLDETYSGEPPVDYASWLIFCIPATIITTTIVWFIFKIVFMRESDICECSKTPHDIIVKKYKELGSITFHELAVCILFIILILLWLFRDPQFFDGWATLVNNAKPKDATAALLIVVLLFMIPSNPMGPYPSPALLNWPMVQSKLAWGVILLRGGGFSMADAANRSGLAKLIGAQLSLLNNISTTGIIITISILASMITEFASNSSVATILLPIAGQLAFNLHINPLKFLIPITLSCSFAFVLPVGTPANALVFSHAGLNSSDMIIPGLISKCVSLIIMLINLHVLGILIFDLNQFPSWASQNQNITSVYKN